MSANDEDVENIIKSIESTKIEEKSKSKAQKVREIRKSGEDAIDKMVENLDADNKKKKETTTKQVAAKASEKNRVISPAPNKENPTRKKQSDSKRA